MSRILIALALLLAIGAARAEVFRWTDADGTVHYSDRKPEKIAAEAIAVDHYAPPAPAAASAAPDEAQASEPAAVAKKPISAVMYLSPTCGYCTKAARFFDARGVPWRGIDITASKQAKRDFDRQGGRGTPLIFLGGQRIAGFDQDHLESVLAQNGW